ncbi:glycosyltransferase [Capnocytophaga sp. oral taxon 323]|nr:glycosyltransferase [Capnocytophaga sp. oral taxon 323]
MKKRCVGTVRRIRKETKIFRRRLGGILMKKGYKEGGGSL